MSDRSNEQNPLARLAPENVTSVAVDPLPVFARARIERRGDIEYRTTGGPTGIASPGKSCALEGEPARALVAALAHAASDPGTQSREGGFRIAVHTTEGSELVGFLPRTAMADQPVLIVVDSRPYLLDLRDFAIFRSLIERAGCE